MKYRVSKSHEILTPFFFLAHADITSFVVWFLMLLQLSAICEERNIEEGEIGGLYIRFP